MISSARFFLVVIGHLAEFGPISTLVQFSAVKTNCDRRHYWGNDRVSFEGPKQKNFVVVKMLLAAFLATMLSGCVVSFSNPLPASQPVRRDDRLMGKWEGRDEQNNPVSIQFEPGSKSETKVSVSGSMDYQNPIFRMVTTKISDNDYMILRLNDPEANKDYMVVRYSISDDKLTVCLLKVDRVKEAIEKRKLKGHADYSPWGGAIVTEGPRGVVAFLRTASRKGLFTCLPELKKVTSK